MSKALHFLQITAKQQYSEICKSMYLFTELFFFRYLTILHDPRGGVSAMTVLGLLGEIQKSVAFSS